MTELLGNPEDLSSINWALGSYELHHEKTCFLHSENKGADQLHGLTQPLWHRLAQLISTFVFAT